jgi:hypothetical protein
MKLARYTENHDTALRAFLSPRRRAGDPVRAPSSCALPSLLLARCNPSRAHRPSFVSRDCSWFDEAGGATGLSESESRAEPMMILELEGLRWLVWGAGCGWLPTGQGNAAAVVGLVVRLLVVWATGGCGRSTDGWGVFSCFLLFCRL